MSGRSADGSGQTQPTQRIDVAMAQFEEDPPTQALPVHEIRASAAQAVPPSYVAGGVPGVPQPHKRKKWPIVVAVIAAIALIGAVIGGVVYSHKHSEALARCRTAVSEFSDARKALLATSDDSPAIQRFIRNVLGVDDILDAVAKASTAAEGTVSDEGCATNATIIQLNLVANTLNSATDSLRDSTKQIKQKARTKWMTCSAAKTSNRVHPMHSMRRMRRPVTPWTARKADCGPRSTALVACLTICARTTMVRPLDLT